MSQDGSQSSLGSRDLNALKITAGLCWLGWVFDFYDLILIVFLRKSIEQSLQVTPDQIPWMIGIGLGASGLGGILFGVLADRYGRKKILTVTVLLFSLGMLLTSFSQNFTQFLVARFITGVGLGGEWAVGHALIAESVPPETRARWSAFIQSGEPIGVALASVMGFVIAPQMGWDWRTVFLLSSCTGFLVLVFQKYMKESPLWQKSERLGIGQRLKETVPFIGEYWPVMLLALVLAIFKLGTYWTCYTWLPRFIEETTKISIERSVLWILCGQLGQFIGMYLFGLCADRLGRRVSFTLFSFITASALIPLALFWDQVMGQPVFWGLMFLLGIGSGCTAGFGALLSELFPTKFRTFAMGTTYNLARGAQLFAPVGVAMAVEQAGIMGGLMVPATLAVLTSLWVWTLPERKGKSLDEGLETSPASIPQVS
ncbi:MAG: MFS transporter [Cyanobacteria bacterium]|nr:MFS transporter [Cyanobacteriota bacterium]